MSQEEQQMSKCKVLFTSMAVLVLFCGSLQAGLVSFNADVPFEMTATGVHLEDALSSIPSVIAMTAEFVAPPDIHPMDASYSTFTVKLTVVNDLTWTWTGYRIEVVGDPPDSAMFVDGTATCAEFGGAPNTGSEHVLEWMKGAGQVLPDDSADFYFELRLGMSPGEQYTFTLIQTPTPEPATIALLGLGTLALIIRRNG
jgi:hypothetical protein